MLISFNFSYLEKFFVAFYFSFIFILAPGASAHDSHDSHKTFSWFLIFLLLRSRDTCADTLAQWTVPLTRMHCVRVGCFVKTLGLSTLCPLGVRVLISSALHRSKQE